MDGYWEECISEAFCDAKIDATKEQIDCVASWVEGAAENHGTATGLDIVIQNHESEEAIKLKKLEAHIEKERIWKIETKPCPSCITQGWVSDQWGRQVTCFACDGEGRIR